MKKSIVIFIVGPTASGKTELACELGKILGSEVISADSMQIYKGMHIASAAPDKEEKKGVSHNLLEFLPYGATFTVADYVDLARKEINRILSNGKTPIVAGGTGLYISALADNTQFLPVKTDKSLREELEAEYDLIGGEEMLKKLVSIDKEAAEKLSPADKRRIVRAFEIYKTSGLTKSKQNELSKLSPPPFTPVIIGVTFKNREKLYERINDRVDIMLKKGLLKEAEAAYKNASGGALQAIGHKEFFDYFKGEETLDEATDKLKRSTRRYAKRQLTWFNKDTRVNWIYRDVTHDVLNEALEIIKRKEEQYA